MKQKRKSRNPFKNRYFTYTLIYICLIGIFTAGMSFSRYTTEDGAADEAESTVYNVYITGENTTQTLVTNLTMNVYATSKLSESSSFVKHTYQRIEIVIHNLSDCPVSLSDFQIIDESDSVYEKLAINMTEDEYSAYEKDSYYGSACSAIKEYITGDTTEGYCGIKLGDSDDDDYDIGTAAEVSKAVDAANVVTFAAMEKECNETYLEAHGGTFTFCITSWVEHDNVYKEDADKNSSTGSISHSTLSELGITSETFQFSVHSEQVD